MCVEKLKDMGSFFGGVSEMNVMISLSMGVEFAISLEMGGTLK